MLQYFTVMLAKVAQERPSHATYFTQESQIISYTRWCIMGGADLGMGGESPNQLSKDMFNISRRHSSGRCAVHHSSYSKA